MPLLNDYHNRLDKIMIHSMLSATLCNNVFNRNKSYVFAVFHIAFNSLLFCYTDLIPDQLQNKSVINSEKIHRRLDFVIMNQIMKWESDWFCYFGPCALEING